jgi:hypothetical protein
MTVLFQSDFEDSSGTIIVPEGAPGWTVPLGQYLVLDASVVSLPAVSGARVMAASDTPDKATYTAAGSLTNQAIRHAAKWQSHTAPQVEGHLLRYVSSMAYYYIYPETNGSSLRLSINYYDGGNNVLGTSGYVLACAVGDVIHHESSMVGTTIESRIWKNSEPRPAAATVSATSSGISSGHPGLVKFGVTGTYALADQVVVTDGAGGEDYFYPEASGVTIDCALGTATASGFTASILAALKINCLLGTASAIGYDAGIFGSASITTDVFKNNTGTVLSNTLIPKVVAIRLSDLVLAASWINQTTDAFGVLDVGSSDINIAAATDYLLVTSSADGSAVGVKKYTAA